MTTPERPAVSCVGGPADRHRLVGASALLGAFLIGMGVAGAAAGAGDERAGVGAPPHPRVRWRNDRASELRPAAAGFSWHGGTVTVASGEHVTVFVSDTYGPDAASVERWAAFFAGLIHGDELGLLTAYIATPAEVQPLCDGADALGCYADDRLVATGEMVDGTAPEEVARHEYGHHVAAHRANPPWPSIEWGAKRWASVENVCARASSGQVFPSDEGARYALNPGEAFAESYRVLNDVRSLGLAVDWRLADASFLPNAAVLQAVADDVHRPWAAARPVVSHGRLSPGRRIWTTRLATPLDGSLSVDLSVPRGVHADIGLLDRGRLLARGSPSGTTSMHLGFLVCGQRTLTVRLTGSAAGTFVLRTARP